LYAVTAYAATVREWCNQSDFVLTVMATGRLAKEHLRIVGYLAQPLYMRVQTTREAGFDSLLNTISKEYFSALFHRDFGQTVLENPALGAGALFQWFPADWHLAPDASLHLGFRVEPLAFKPRGFFHEKFKLGVFVYETADHLSIRAGFRPDCVRRATVERLLEEIRAQLERQALNGQ
jgi:non-ribosomal peptide synthetase component F